MRKLLILAVALAALLQTAEVRSNENDSQSGTQSSSSASAPSPSPASPGVSADIIKALESRVDELEALNMMNHFRLSGYFSSRYDNITYRPNNDASQSSHTQIFTIRTALNVDAEISEQLRFFSTFGMNKPWNILTSVNSANEDVSGSYNRTSSAVYIDRAYIDYGPKFLPVTLSIGRLPTINGPPTNIPDGEPRFGTYPRMAFNTIVDGAAITIHAGKLLPQGNSLNLRAIYTPFGQYDFASPYKQISSGGTQYDSQMPGITAMLDYSWTPTKSFVRSINLILEYQDSGRMVISPTIINPDQSLAGDLGTRQQTFLAYLELNDIGRTGLDFAGSVTEHLLKTTGSYVLANPGIPIIVGDGVRKDGTGILLTLRYQIPISAINRPYIGCEYLWSTKYYNLFDFASDDLTHFYTTRGRAFHVYYTQPLVDSLSMRIGYRLQNAIATGFESEGVFPSNDRFRTFYVNLRLGL